MLTRQEPDSHWTVSHLYGVILSHSREHGAVREMRDAAAVGKWCFRGGRSRAIDSAKANNCLIGQIWRENAKTAAESRLSQPLPPSRPLDAVSSSRPEDRDRAAVVNPQLPHFQMPYSDPLLVAVKEAICNVVVS